MKFLKNPRLAIVGSFLVGFALTMGAWTWWDMQTPQTQYYDRGVIAYTQGDYELAIKDFDLSVVDYNARVNAVLGRSDAPPSLEQAELAQQHKALALLKMRQDKPAVLAFKECLRLSDDIYMSLHTSEIAPGTNDRQALAAAYAKIKEDRNVCQTNLEILFHQKPQMAQAEGKGKGASKGKGDGKNADQTSEDPSNSAGKLNRTGVND